MAKYRKLGRTSSQRKALLRNQVTNLLYKGKIVTTEAKAKEVCDTYLAGIKEQRVFSEEAYRAIEKEFTEKIYIL